MPAELAAAMRVEWLIRAGSLEALIYRKCD
jgi:hypothetical protein